MVITTNEFHATDDAFARQDTFVVHAILLRELEAAEVVVASPEETMQRSPMIVSSLKDGGSPRYGTRGPVTSLVTKAASTAFLAERIADSVSVGR